MKLLQAIGSLFRETAVHWSRDRASILAAGLAYYAIFSLAPLLVIAIAVAGLVFGEAAAQDQIVDMISGSVGPEVAVTIQLIIKNASQNSSGVWATGLSIGLLLLGASGVFNQLKRALNTIWGIRPEPKNGIIALLKARALSFSMVLLVGFLLLVSLASRTVMAALDAYLSEWLPQLAQISRLEFLVSLGMITLLFAIIFKSLPDASIAWRDVLLGAGVTALLFGLGEYLIGLYLSRGVDSPYGAAGSLVVLLLWIYYSAQILLFGAEFTQVYANKYGSRVRPSPQAVWVNGDALPPMTPLPVEPPPTALPTEMVVTPNRPLFRQIAAGLLGVAAGLFLSYLSSLRGRQKD